MIADKSEIRQQPLTDADSISVPAIQIRSESDQILVI